MSQPYSALLHNIHLLSLLSLPSSSPSLPAPSIVLLCSPHLSPSPLISSLCLSHPTLLLSNTLLSSNQYQLYTSSLPVKPHIYLLPNIGCKSIKDSDYKLKKKYLYKLSKKGEVIYVVLMGEKEGREEHLGVHFVEELDPLGKRSLVVRMGEMGEEEVQGVLGKVAELYLGFQKLPIVTSYRSLLKQKHLLTTTLSSIQSLNLLLSHSSPHLFSHLYKQHHLFLTSLLSQLSGSFLHTASLNLKTPLKCLIMTQLQEFFSNSFNTTLKNLESITVKQIEQLLLIYNTELMHGFLSSNCFKSIFYTYMLEVKEGLMEAVEGVVEILLVTVEHMVYYHFKYFTLKPLYHELLHQKLLLITTPFLTSISSLIHSQIQYIYMSDEKYWKLNTINTSLYSNSTFLEIKYVGISYIKKLGESLQEILPKIVGDGLIERVGGMMREESLMVLQEVAKEGVEVEVGNAEREKGVEVERRWAMVEEVMRYFVRYVDGVSLIPDVQGKIEKMWRSCEEKQNPEEPTQNTQPLSFFEKIKRLFRRPSTHSARRSSSQQRTRKAQIQTYTNQHLSPAPNPLHIKQSQWLLAINTNKHLPLPRLLYSSKQGFPSFLRISIWVHLSSTNFSPPSIKQLLHPSSLSHLLPSTYSQIQKDIRRTPPSELFAFNDSAKQIMQDVLIAYSIYDPEVGYVQGMNFIVSMILRTILRHEEKDFLPTLRKHEANNFTVIEQQTLTILAYVIKKLNWRGFFVEGTPKLFEFSLKLEDRVKGELPGVYEKMGELEMSAFLIWTEAVMTVMTAKMELAVVQRVFDRFLVEGEKVVEGVVMGLLRGNEGRIKECRNGDELFGMMREGMYQGRFAQVVVEEVLRGKL